MDDAPTPTAPILVTARCTTTTLEGGRSGGRSVPDTDVACIQLTSESPDFSCLAILHGEDLVLDRDAPRELERALGEIADALWADTFSWPATNRDGCAEYSVSRDGSSWSEVERVIAEAA